MRLCIDGLYIPNVKYDMLIKYRDYMYHGDMCQYCDKVDSCKNISDMEKLMVTEPQDNYMINTCWKLLRFV